MTVGYGILDPLKQYFGDDGKPLNGGFVYAFKSGTNTPLNTYSDPGLTTAHAHPIVLDPLGKSVIYLLPRNYTLDVHDSHGVSIDGFPIDNVRGLPATTVFNLLDFGGVGDGSTDNSAALQAAVDAAAAAPTGGTVVIPPAAVSYKLASSVTSLASVALEFQKGGIFSFGNGVTLTIHGAIQAGLYRLFSVSGTGAVAGLGDSWAEWFGATYDGTTDDGPAWVAALAALPTTGGCLHVSTGTTYTGTTALVPSGAATQVHLTIRGNGHASIFKCAITDGSFLFDLPGNAGMVCEDFAIWLTQSNSKGLQLRQSREIALVRHLHIYGVGPTNTNVAIRITSSGGEYAFQPRIEDCYIETVKTGIDLFTQVTTAVIQNCGIIGVQSPVMTGSVAIRIGASCGGVVIAGNDIEGWDTGITGDATATGIQLLSNNLETFTTKAVNLANTTDTPVLIGNIGLTEANTTIGSPTFTRLDPAVPPVLSSARIGVTAVQNVAKELLTLPAIAGALWLIAGDLPSAAAGNGFTAFVQCGSGGTTFSILASTLVGAVTALTVANTGIVSVTQSGATQGVYGASLRLI